MRSDGADAWRSGAAAGDLFACEAAWLASASPRRDSSRSGRRRVALGAVSGRSLPPACDGPRPTACAFAFRAAVPPPNPVREPRPASPTARRILARYALGSDLGSDEDGRARLAALALLHDQPVALLSALRTLDGNFLCPDPDKPRRVDWHPGLDPGSYPSTLSVALVAAAVDAPACFIALPGSAAADVPIGDVLRTAVENFSVGVVGVLVSLAGRPGCMAAEELAGPWRDSVAGVLDKAEDRRKLVDRAWKGELELRKLHGKEGELPAEWEARIAETMGLLKAAFLRIESAYPTLADLYTLDGPHSHPVLYPPRLPNAPVVSSLLSSELSHAVLPCHAEHAFPGLLIAPAMPSTACAALVRMLSSLPRASAAEMLPPYLPQLLSRCRSPKVMRFLVKEGMLPPSGCVAMFLAGEPPDGSGLRALKVLLDHAARRSPLSLVGLHGRYVARLSRRGDRGAGGAGKLLAVYDPVAQGEDGEAGRAWRGWLRTGGLGGLPEEVGWEVALLSWGA